MSPRFAVVVLVAAVAGCGEEAGDVTGTVRFKNKTIRSGHVLMIAANGQPRYGVIDSSGNYEIKNVPIGAARVVVNSPNPSARAAVPEIVRSERRVETRKPRAPRQAKDGDAEAWFPVPRKYSDPANSPLKHHVTVGAVRFDIDLE